MTVLSVLFFSTSVDPRPCLPLELHSFPTRRSSDLLRCSMRVTLPAPVRRRENCPPGRKVVPRDVVGSNRSEEHTSALQSRENIVCRLVPECSILPAMSFVGPFQVP